MNLIGHITSFGHPIPLDLRFAFASASHYLYEWKEYFVECPGADRLRLSTEWIEPVASNTSWFRLRFENRLALTTTHPFTGYFFVDLSDENAQALRQRCNASPHARRVDIRTGDCNDLVDDVVAHIKQDESRSLNLAFLDPEGMELRWETVAKLASVRRMDLIINYPQGGLNRNMRQAFEPNDQTCVDAFFGSREWREIYQDRRIRGASQGLHRQLIDFYRQRLQGLGYTDFRQVDQGGSEPLIRNIKRGAPLYRLLFASKHPLGHDFWDKVTSTDVYGQTKLF